MKYCRVILLFVFAFTQSYSQDLKKDLESINAVYANAKKYSITYEYLYFETDVAKTPYNTTKSAVTKVNNNYYYKQGDYETIICNDYSIRVDHNDKSITLLPQKRSQTAQSPTSVNLDSLSKFCKKAEFKKISADINAYVFTMNAGAEYDKLEVRFNKATFQITRLLYHFKNLDISDDDKENITNPRIEIIFSKINTAIALQEKDLSYEKFLIKKGKNYELKPEYAKYKLYAY